MNIIEMSDIKKVYGRGQSSVSALRGINLSIAEGELISIMGPSGSGKSTLLNIMGFLDKADCGTYTFEGSKVAALSDSKAAIYRNKHIGFVVQNFALIDDYTIYQNVKIPLDYAKVSGRTKTQKIEEVLKLVGILDKKDKLPCELSGGQNQRAAIARALVNSPDIILADEPTGSLDKDTGTLIMEIFKKLNEEGKTVIIITHDERIAHMCHRIIHIEDGAVKGEE